MNLFTRLIILFLILNLAKNKVLDSGKIIVPIHKSFTLKCQNKTTEGKFAAVVWQTEAYSSNIKNHVYSYDNKNKEHIDSNIKNRIKRYDETSIKILSAQLKDSGNWECNILLYKRNSLYKKVRVLAVYDVVVVSPPIITHIFPQLVAVPKKYQGTSICYAQGASRFNISWVKVKGQHTSYVYFSERSHFDNGIFFVRKQIFLDNLSLQDTGAYMCIAENMAGKTFHNIQVKLQVSPTITSQTRFTGNMGDIGELRCNATGFPAVSFYWKFVSHYETIVLRSKEQFKRFSVSDTYYYTQPDGQQLATSKLSIRNVKKKDWVLFTCTAENEVGFDVKDIEFTGFSVPDSPKLLHKNIVSYSNHIKLFWELGNNGGLPIRSIIIQQKVYSSVQWNTIQLSKTLTEYNVMNLQPNTVYDLRVASANKVGQSKFSQTFAIETKEKEETTESSNDYTKNIIGNLNIVSLLAVGGGIVIGLTCCVACFCLYLQDRQIKRANMMQAQQMTSEQLLKT